MLLADAPPAKRPVAVVPVGEAAERAAPTLAERLRRAGFRVELGYRGNLKRRLAAADKAKAAVAVIIGEAELAANNAQVKNLDTGEQAGVPLAALEERLAPWR
jgi:histidyl-tRNA synthetase